MKDELLPCPFCGGEAFVCTMIGGDEPMDNFRFFIYCENGCVDMPKDENKEEAIKAWNTRAKDKGERE